MVKKVVRILIDDVTGEEIPEDGGRTVVIGYEGASYQLDLSHESIEQLEAALDPYLKAGKKLAKADRPRQRADSSSGRTPEELALIRTWAADNGYKVAARGRVKREIIEAYEAAN